MWEDKDKSEQLDAIMKYEVPTHITQTGRTKPTCSQNQNSRWGLSAGAILFTLHTSLSLKENIETQLIYCYISE